MSKKFKTNNPGSYAYRCRHCGHLAFGICGEDRPVSFDIDDVEISQRGQYVSKSTASLACQHCAIAVSLPGGNMNGAEVVSVFQFCSNRGITPEDEGVGPDEMVMADVPAEKKEPEPPKPKKGKKK